MRIKKKAIVYGAFVSLFILYGINRVFFSTFDSNKIVQHNGVLMAKPSLESGGRGSGPHWKLQLKGVIRFYKLDKFDNETIVNELRNLKKGDSIILFTYSEYDIPALGDFLSGRYTAVGAYVGTKKSLGYDEIKSNLESTDNVALFLSFAVLFYYIYWLYKNELLPVNMKASSKN